MILKGLEKLEIGRIYNDLEIYDRFGNAQIIPFVPLREATRKEFLNQIELDKPKLSPRDIRELNDPNCHFYEVSID